MGIVKEPEGVDFVIQSPPLTDSERKEISEFIQKSKLAKAHAVKRTAKKMISKVNS